MAVILAVLILVPTVAFAQCSETGYMPEDNNFYISGNVPDGTEGDAITLLLRDSDGNIKYVNQYALDKNLKYCAKFKLREYNEDWVLSVREGDSDVTNGVEVAIVTDSSSRNLYQVDCDVNRQNDGQALINVNINNKYRNSGTSDLIIAFYDNNGSVINVSIKPINIEYQETNVSIFVDIPQNAEKIKVFMWKNTVSAIPLATAFENNKLHSDVFGSDRVAFIGDSIGAGIYTTVSYPTLIEYLYKTRNLDSSLMVSNKSISGDSAKGALVRLDWDVFAASEQEKENPNPRAIGDSLSEYYGDPQSIVIALGTNTIGYGTRKLETTLTEAAIEARRNATNQLKELIDGIIAHGVMDITVATPGVGSKCSETNGEIPVGLNLTYAEMTRQYKELVMQYNAEGYNDIKFIDLTTKLIETVNRDTMITSPDNLVHYNSNCHMIASVEFLKESGVSPIVSKTVIDGENASAYNADVSDLNVSSSEISYNYSPKALPVATKADYTDEFYSTFNVNRTECAYENIKAGGYDIENIINREIIEVDNLKSGNYEITLDDRSIGVYSAAELREGVNIAEFEQNPNQIVSRTLFGYYMHMFRATAALRSIYGNMIVSSLYDQTDTLEKAKVYAKTNTWPLKGNSNCDYDKLVNAIKEDRNNIEKLVTEIGVKSYRVRIIKK